jgi:hypothetical protein
MARATECRAEHIRRSAIAVPRARGTTERPTNKTPPAIRPGVFCARTLLVRMTVAVTMAVAVVFLLGGLLDDGRLGGQDHPARAVHRHLFEGSGGGRLGR